MAVNHLCGRMAFPMIMNHLHGPELIFYDCKSLHWHSRCFVGVSMSQIALETFPMTVSYLH